MTEPYVRIEDEIENEKWVNDFPQSCTDEQLETISKGTDMGLPDKCWGIETELRKRKLKKINNNGS